VPRAPAGEDRGKPEVKSKPEKMKRPEGMSREAFALLGGSNPVIPTHLLGEQLHSSWNIDINPAAQIATQLQILAGWSCVMRHLEQHCRSSSSSSKGCGPPRHQAAQTAPPTAAANLQPGCRWHTGSSNATGVPEKAAVDVLPACC
jgi:hypothetical protein